MALLPDDQIRRLHAATLATQLAESRGALLGGIKAAFVASLAVSPNPSAQVLSDLHALNAIERLADGTVPLLSWLENAVTLAGYHVEARVFCETIKLIHRGERNAFGGEGACSSTGSELDFLVGVWKEPLRGSTYYIRRLRSALRCVYCYGGNDSLTGEFFDLQIRDGSLVGSFRWFDSDTWGYAYFHIQSADWLEGAWWERAKLPTGRIDKFSPVFGRGTAITWIRQREHVQIPDWVEEGFQMLEKT